MSNVIGVPPIFTGKQGSLTIDEFFVKMERWFLINDTRANRWPGILDTNIDYPAKTNYDAALIAGAAPGIEDVPDAAQAAPGADEAEQRAATLNRHTAWRAQYTNRKTWLFGEHHGPFEQ